MRILVYNDSAVYFMAYGAVYVMLTVNKKSFFKENLVPNYPKNFLTIIPIIITTMIIRIMAVQNPASKISPIKSHPLMLIIRTNAKNKVLVEV